MNPPPELPPIVRSIAVPWAPVDAFRRFTEEFGQWWPRDTHSIGGKHVTRVVFEARLGGRIFEEHDSGRRFQWGVVQAWEPPGRVVFTWHPSRREETAQTVELRFDAEGTGTRLTLTSSDWHRWGAGARGAHRGYDLGWAWVLETWAGVRSVRTALLSGLMRAMQLVQHLRGGQAAVIARAEGEFR